MRNEVDFLSGYAIGLAQHGSATFAHHHEARGKRAQLLKYPVLVRTGVLQDRVQGGNDRYAEVAQKRQNKTAAGAAINSVFMLKADHISIAKIQVIGCTTI